MLKQERHLSLFLKLVFTEFSISRDRWSFISIFHLNKVTEKEMFQKENTRFT